MTAWLMLDVSASMTFGTAQRRKADVAEGVALAVGHVATRRGNRLGVVAFGGAEPRVLRPRQGRLGLLGLLAELRAEPAADGAGDGARWRMRLQRRRARSPARAGSSSSCRTSAARATGRRRCARCARATACWRSRSATRASSSCPPVGDLWMVDPETGRQIVVNTSRKRCASASRPPRRPSARRWRPRCAARAPTTSCFARTATGCATWPGTCAGRSRCATARWWPAARAARRRRRTPCRRRGAAEPAEAAAPQPRRRAARGGARVSFREPAVLLGLLLLPLALLVYLAMQRRRRREAAAFANPALMPNLVTAPAGLAPPRAAGAAPAGRRRPRRRARPARSAPSPRRSARRPCARQRRVGLDASRRRRARAGSRRRSSRPRCWPTRSPDNFRIGLVTFSDYARADRRADDRSRRGGGARSTGWWPTAARRWATASRAGSRPRARRSRPRTGAARAGCRRSSCCSRTARTRSGVVRPARRRRAGPALQHPRLHRSRSARRPARSSQQDPFGFTQRIPVPPDKETLREIARSTGGRFFEAVSADDAEQIYSRIGTRLSSKPVKREVTVAFAGGALVLLLAGGALSLVWFGRLP